MKLPQTGGCQCGKIRYEIFRRRADRRLPDRIVRQCRAGRRGCWFDRRRP